MRVGRQTIRGDWEALTPGTEINAYSRRPLKSLSHDPNRIVARKNALPSTTGSVNAAMAVDRSNF